MENGLKKIFERLAAGRDLGRAETRGLFVRIMAGDVPPVVTGAVLGALLTKGECVDELVGAAEAMRDRMVPIRCDRPCIDTCGTGGDGISTFNVSTTAAIIAAAAGATVAKHGNRSTTRVSGSTEVLTKLGIDVEADTAVVEKCLDQVGIAYLNARLLHPAMRHAAAVRRAIPVRTIFNLLGPLTNPAGAKWQVLGVPREDLMERMAAALITLGTRHAWVVHGQALCDLTATGTTAVWEVRDGQTRRFTVTPESVGLRQASVDDLRVTSVQQSADTVLSVLRGDANGPRDHALMNAGAALVVADVVSDLAAGVAAAATAIDDGRAMATLDRWRSVAGISRIGPRTDTDAADGKGKARGA